MENPSREGWPRSLAVEGKGHRVSPYRFFPLAALMSIGDIEKPQAVEGAVRGGDLGSAPGVRAPPSSIGA
jgi:hypothetical protein